MEGEPEMPKWLNQAERKIWRKVVAQMLAVDGLLTIADDSVLADYCSVRAKKEALEKAMQVRERENVKAFIAQAATRGQAITEAEARNFAVRGLAGKIRRHAAQTLPPRKHPSP